MPLEGREPVVGLGLVVYRKARGLSDDVDCADFVGHNPSLGDSLERLTRTIDFSQTRAIALLLLPLEECREQKSVVALVYETRGGAEARLRP